MQGNQWMQYSPDFKFTISENNVNLEKLPPVKDETKSLLRSFGRYETEKEFAGAPAVFLSYARKEWLKFIIERIE